MRVSVIDIYMQRIYDLKKENWKGGLYFASILVMVKESNSAVLCWKSSFQTREKCVYFNHYRERKVI